MGGGSCGDLRAIVRTLIFALRNMGGIGGFYLEMRSDIIYNFRVYFDY